MFKNNIRVFFSYFLIILLSFVLLFFLNKLFVNSMIRLDNLLIKGFFLLIYFLFFYLLGKIVSIKENPRTDFFSFIFVFIFGLIVLGLASLSGSLAMEDNLNIIILPAQVFLSPYIFVLSIFGKRIGFINYIILSILFSILIGFSTKRKRVVHRYKR